MSGVASDPYISRHAASIPQGVFLHRFYTGTGREMEVTCPVCGHKWADESGGGGKVTYYQCPECGAVFAVKTTEPKKVLQLNLAVYY